MDFDLQTPAAETAGEATILDEEEATEKVGEAIDEAVVVLDKETLEEEGAANERNSGSNESTQDSGNDEKKSKLERKAEKERKKQEKREKKDKNKDKKKPCEVCTTEQEHREHRKEKKKAKKEKQEKKREKKDVPVIPPLPSGFAGPTYKTRMNGDNFFQKLLIKETPEKSTKMERPSRPTLRKAKEVKRPVLRASEPALGGYLKGKQAVTDNKFKQYDEFEKFVEEAMLPKGIVKCEEFNEKKSLFEKQLEESPIMPRSSSSMSRFLLQNILIRHFIFVNPDMPGLRQLSVPALPFPTVQTLATAGQKNLFFGFSTYFNTLGQSVFLVLDHQCPKEANPPFCWIRFSSCYLRPLF